MQVGVVLPAAEVDGRGETPRWPAIRSFARRVEELGLDSVWMFDHFFYEPPQGPREGMHEPWTILSAIGAVTERVTLGTIVLCGGFRHPALLAKMAVTLDEVSAGRLLLGLGAGWHDPEYDAFGFPKDHRVDRFEEVLRIVSGLLDSERVTFDGTYWQTSGAELLPPPERRIPIMVAAFGPRMLRLTARYGQAWNTAWFGSPSDRLREQLAAMDAACGAEARDPSTLVRTVGIRVLDPERTGAPGPDEAVIRGEVGEIAEALTGLATLGFDHAIVGLEPLDEASLDRLGSAVTMVRG